MVRICKVLSLVALSLTCGWLISKCTNTEEEVDVIVDKEVSIDVVPDVRYIHSNSFIIVPIVEKDTLVKPKDYQYVYRDTIVKDGTEIKVEADGWGDIERMKFDIVYKDTIKYRLPKPTNNMYLSGVYMKSFGMINSPMYGMSLDYTIRDKVIIGAMGTVGKDDFYGGLKIGFKIN